MTALKQPDKTRQTNAISAFVQHFDAIPCFYFFNEQLTKHPRQIEKTDS
jgi:hypothetical protein